MGNVAFLRLQVEGGRKDARLAEEEWQFGFHLVPTLAAPVPDIYAIAGDFDATYDTGTSSAADYSADRNFLLEGGITDIDPLDYMTDQVAPAVKAYIGATGMFSNDIYVKRMTLYPMGADGKSIMLSAGIAKVSYTCLVSTNWDGASTAATTPPFETAAVSLVTSANIPRGRGRFYPPPHIASYVTTTGLIGSSQRTDMVNNATTLLASMSLAQGAGDAYIRPVIIGAPWTTAYAVKSVRVGDVPDTQRRRKRQLTESYALGAITYP